jgi:hypothetical protein
MGTKRNLSVADLCNEEVPFTPPATPEVNELRLHEHTDSTGLANEGIRNASRQPKPPVSRSRAGHIVGFSRKPYSRTDEQDANGQVNFHSHETDDSEIRKQHRRFNLYPESGIENHPSHVAFKSDKRGFQTRTGRSGFESKQSAVFPF